MAHDVFISYSSENKIIADAVCSFLEREKIRCWISPRDIIPGSNYGKSIIKAIEGARIMVIVFTSDANKSPQVMREVERAVNRGITIIPLRVEDISPSKDMEYYIASCHWLDAIDPPLERHLSKLSHSVTTLIEGISNELHKNGVSFGSDKKKKTAIRWLPILLFLALVGILLVRTFDKKRQEKTLATDINKVKILQPENGASLIGPFLKLSWEDNMKSADLSYELELEESNTGKRYIRHTIGTYYHESKAVGLLKWKVRSVSKEISGKRIYGPWSESHQVRYYPDALTRILDTRTVHLGIAKVDDYGVFVSKKNDILDGYEIELLRTIILNEFRKRNLSGILKISYTSSAWGDAFFRLLENPEVDLLASGISITKQREEKYCLQFSNFTAEFPQTIITWKDTKPFSDGILLLKKLGVANDTTNEEFAREFLGEESNTRLKIYPEKGPYFKMIEDLLKKKIDGILMDKPYAMSLINNNITMAKDCLITFDLMSEVNSQFRKEKIGFAIRPTDKELIKIINHFLSTSQDKRRSIEKKYFPYL